MTEVVNLKALKEYMQAGVDSRQSQLQSYIKRAQPFEDAQGMAQVTTEYFATETYGCSLSKRSSAQSLTRVARAIAFSGHGVDVDFCNAHPQLMANLLREEVFRGDESLMSCEYPMIHLYCKHYQKWREFAAAYKCKPGSRMNPRDKCSVW